MNDKLKEALYNTTNPIVNTITLYCDGTELFTAECRTPDSSTNLFFNRLEKIFDDNGYGDLFVHMITYLTDVNEKLKEAKYFDNVNLYTLTIFKQ